MFSEIDANLRHATRRSLLIWFSVNLLFFPVAFANRKNPNEKEISFCTDNQVQLFRVFGCIENVFSRMQTHRSLTGHEQLLAIHLGIMSF